MYQICNTIIKCSTFLLVSNFCHDYSEYHTGIRVGCLYLQYFLLGMFFAFTNIVKCHWT